MLRHTRGPFRNTLYTCLITLAIGYAGAHSWAASPGLPFTENFTDSSLQDSSQTNANWSPEEQAVYLQWRDHVRAGRANWPSTGTAVGSSDTDFTVSIALGDVDGDGDLDVVAGNSGQNKVYLNDGDAAPFDSITNGTAVGSADTDDTRSIALGDVDGDGDLDVVAGNYNQANKVYLNDGSGGFGAGTAVGSLDADATWSIAVGDVDGDGDLDMVAGNATFGGGDQNKVYLNNGGAAPFRTIANGTPVGSADTYATRSVALGDVDGDGDLDVVAGNLGQTNRVYLNDGDAAPFDTIANGTPVGAFDTDLTYSIALGDVNGDGKLDVIAGNGGQNKLYLNDGDAAPFDSIVNGTPVGSADWDPTLSIALGDVDGDGDLDVVAGNSGMTNKLYLNDGSAAPFDSIVNGTALGSADTDATRSIALGDVDGDGDLDVIAGNLNQANKLYLNDGDTAPFDSIVNGTVVGSADSDPTYSIALGDVDGDGDLDVVAGNSGVTNKLYLNDGDTAPFDTITNGSAVGTDTDATQSITLGDVDGDGDLDVVAGNIFMTNKVYLNDGDAAPFDSITNGIAVGSADTDATLSIALGDVDGDGDLDVVAGNNNQVNKVYLNRAYDTGLGLVTSLKVNDTETNIARATLSATEVANTPATRNTDIRYYLSNNGGTQWHQVEPAAAFDFSAYGSDLRWKAEFASLSPSISPQIDTIVIEENLVSYNGTTATTLRDAFASLDANGDGFLSLAEAGFAYLAELKPYDEDGDGQLSLSDLLELTVGPVGVAATVYLDFAYGGIESGTLAEPFDSLLEAATFVANGGTVNIATGTSSETILINKDVDLVATGGTVTIGTP